MPHNVHVDHVGSLLRPAALFEQRQRLLGVHDADTNLGPHKNDELTELEDGFVRDAVKMQENCGLPIVTDGEFRRRSWWTDFILSLTGTHITYVSKLPVSFINAAGEKRPAPGIAIRDKVEWQESCNVRPFEFLKSVAKASPKISLPGPPIVHFMREGNFVPDVYRSLEEFWEDIIAAWRAEIDALAKAGCWHIQIDECMLAWLCDPRHQQFAKDRGEDARDLAQTYCRVIDAAISARPKDMTAAIHSCRGNMNSFWGAEGSYDYVAELMFNEIGADMYLLEYDTPRAGDFSPLTFVPKGKKVLLGLVSTKDARLETRDELKQRVEEASQFMNGDALGLCPQCGFSTNVFGTGFTEDDERRKLDLLVETADRIWG
ncbi:MAG: 5-methyltetrahydropteroyltriglutamate--homocysteine S-methyltransferase [Beijerinckiaceae bacterium]